VLSLADLFRVHADKCIRTALNRRDLKEVQTLLALAQERIGAAAAIEEARK
jgi:hypothetical protein